MTRENQMTSTKTAKIVGARLVLMGVGLILLSGGSSFLDKRGSFGIKPASANSQLGILGQQAPELELNSWIDDDGKPINPIRLQDYRGKVVYLYFFQDW